MENIDKIRIACCKILADENLLPHDGITYCNVGVALILDELGYGHCIRKADTGEPLMANEMYDILDKNFEKVDLDYCRLSIVSGNVFVACQKGDPHGHIAVIYPVITLSYSSKWRCAVPLCANVGKENGIIGLNWAFEVVPDIFKLGVPK